MRLRSALTFGAALIASAAPALAAPRFATPEAELQHIIGDRVAGQPVSCINLGGSTSSQIVDGTAIVYRIGSKLYVNRLRDGGRQFLDDDDILVTRTFGSQLCNLDTVRLLDRTSRIPHGFVVLDKFVPYSRPSQTR